MVAGGISHSSHIVVLLGYGHIVLIREREHPFGSYGELRKTEEPATFRLTTVEVL